MKKSIVSQLWHHFFPAPCLWCTLPVNQQHSLLCQSCEQALPHFPYTLCHYNLMFLPTIRAGLPKTTFDQLLSLSWYQQPYQHWITSWKFNKNPYSGELLLQKFTELLQEYQEAQPLPQAIVYVPMSPQREKERGFNQAKLLAENAANALNLPLLDCLKRHQHSNSQVGLGRQQRLFNLQQAFYLESNTTLPSHLALVDDVVTTGSTANRLCRLLKQQGVKQVSLWTLAITASPHQRRR